MAGEEKKAKRPYHYWTDEQREAALHLVNQLGVTEAARVSNVPLNTLRRWVVQENVRTNGENVTGQIVEAREERLRLERLKLAERTYAEANGFLDALHLPSREEKAMTVGDGGGMTHIEIARIDRDRPTFAEWKTIMVAFGIAVDKAQLLSGEATERKGLNGEETERLVASILDSLRDADIEDSKASEVVVSLGRRLAS